MITLGCLSRYPRKGEGLSVIILMKAELCFCRKTDLITLSGKLDEIEIGKWTKASKKKMILEHTFFTPSYICGKIIAYSLGRFGTWKIFMVVHVVYGLM